MWRYYAFFPTILAAPAHIFYQNRNQESNLAPGGLTIKNTLA